ncbi:MAG TPA: hypothetical protein DIW47_11900 [Bacteroidetes bacterium]|nr:hypothetical protein [Bacteroidota bacterium]
MNTQKRVVLTIAAIGMLTTFMPWVQGQIPGGTMVRNGEEWITLALFAIPVLLCLLNNRSAPLSGFKLYAAVLPAIFVALIAILKMDEFSSIITQIDPNHPFAEFMDTDVTIGFGLYLLLLAALALPVAAFWLRGRSTDHRP